MFIVDGGGGGASGRLFSGVNLDDVAADAVELEPPFFVVIVQAFEVVLDGQPLAADVANVLQTFASDRFFVRSFKIIEFPPKSLSVKTTEYIIFSAL